MDTEILLCECNSAEHQVIFNSFTEDDGEESVYVNIHLHNPSFWKRLKYLFGHKSNFGAWDEVIIPKQKFKEMAEKLSSNTK